MKIHAIRALRLFGAALALASMVTAMPAHADEQADRDWQELQTTLEASKARLAEPVKATEHREKAQRQYRDLGLAFYAKHPEDARRWTWLLQTMQRGPSYFLSAEQVVAGKSWKDALEVKIDEAALAAWDKRLQTELVPAFLASPQTTAEQRLELYGANLQNKSFQAYRRAQQGQPVDLEAYQREILTVSKLFPEDMTGYWHAGKLLESADDWGMTDGGKRAFANAMAASPNEKLRELGQGKQHLFTLLDDPAARLNMTLKTLDGKVVNLADLRGKIVMLDFWALSCSACIDGMPHVKEVYERYGDQGFMVLGVAFNDEADKAKVAALMKKMDIPWETSLQSSSTPDSLWKRFGFTTLGELFLIDQQGRLVANELGDVGKIELKVRELLKLPQVSQN